MEPNLLDARAFADLLGEPVGWAHAVMDLGVIPLVEKDGTEYVERSVALRYAQGFKTRRARTFPAT